MNRSDFDLLWQRLMEPIRALDKRVTNIERQAWRAEIAGGVATVSTLPSAGQTGRMLYKTGTSAGLYVDNGTSWVGPLT